MEFVVDDLRRKPPSPRSLEDLHEVRRKVELYLRAWRLPLDWQPELVSEIMAVVKLSSLQPGEPDLMRLAVQEADRRIAARLSEILKSPIRTDGDGVLAEDRAALFCADWPAKGHSEGTAIVSAYSRAKIAWKHAQHPRRELQTDVRAMKSTLSKLPSFRMIAGWCGLILALVLVFIFTRQS